MLRKYRKPVLHIRDILVFSIYGFTKWSPNSMTFSYWQFSEAQNWITHIERLLSGKDRSESGEDVGAEEGHSRKAEWYEHRHVGLDGLERQRIRSGSGGRWVWNGHHEPATSGPCRQSTLKDHDKSHIATNDLRKLKWHQQVGWTRIRVE